MSRSNPPRSNIVERVRSSSPPAAAPLPPHDRHLPRRKLLIKVAAWTRWLHIYLSMFGLAAVLFFSVTGVTLNHPDWFAEGASSRAESRGRVDRKWLHLPSPPPPAGEEPDLAREVSRLEVVEHLRKTHGIHGAVADFKVDEAECVVTFKGPGYAADAFIDRSSGDYTLSQTYHGLVSVLNDLHKGRDTGHAWSLLIDASAVLMTVISLTGLVLLFYIKRRRMAGFLVGLVGAALVLAVFRLFVP